MLVMQKVQSTEYIIPPGGPKRLVGASSWRRREGCEQRGCLACYTTVSKLHSTGWIQTKKAFIDLKSLYGEEQNRIGFTPYSSDSSCSFSFCWGEPQPAGLLVIFLDVKLVHLSKKKWAKTTKEGNFNMGEGERP